MIDIDIMLRFYYKSKHIKYYRMMYNFLRYIEFVRGLSMICVYIYPDTQNSDSLYTHNCRIMTKNGYFFKSFTFFFT
jgi:hypothetical protein